MSRNYNYRPISSFGGVQPDISNNPITYCLLDNVDNSFNHGENITFRGPQSKSCQMFMSERCSQNWDSVCDFAYKNKNNIVPNMLQQCNNQSDSAFLGLTEGQILLKNTAEKKYVDKVSTNCVLNYEPFDPTVANSPMISYLTTSSGSYGPCVSNYEVNPENIDNDPVMKNILDNPKIAINLLINIYNTAVRKGTLEKLNGTNLYNFFKTPYFQQNAKISKNTFNSTWI